VSRLEVCFKSLEASKQKALVPFITAGDPDAAFTLACMHKMVEAGVNIIELGVPFSDPMADGPVIQKASERALAAGMSLKGVLEIVKQFRTDNQTTPIILMGYLNPIEFMGYESFAQQAAQAGVDGVLTVDIPPEESAELVAAFEKNNLAAIYLLAPTSPKQRIKRVAEIASGYIYYVSLKGVTGAGNLQLDEVRAKLTEIRRETSLPLAIGFGVKSPEIAAEVARIGDAVVVGSALIECITNNPANIDDAQQDIFNLLSDMRSAMDAVTQ
jgi:tryptophan synthase alpha chain